MTAPASSAWSGLSVAVGRALAPHMGAPDSAPPVVRDLIDLATGGARATALDGRYGPALADIAGAIADGAFDPAGPNAPGIVIATLSAQRERWRLAGIARLGAYRTDRTVTLPPVADVSRIRYRGIPSGPIGDPEVATHGHAGYAPDDFALARAHDVAARAIDRALARDRHRIDRAPRRVRFVSGTRSAGGTWTAIPGDRGKRRRRRR